MRHADAIRSDILCSDARRRLYHPAVGQIPYVVGGRSAIERDYPLYRPDLERDACGVGFLADVRGRRTHEIVQRGLRALSRLTHRGAPPETSSVDGAGVLTHIPWA